MYTFFYVKVLEANPVSVSPCAPIRRAMHTNSTPQILISENILILFILDVFNERLDMHAQRESAHTVCWGVFDSEAAPNGSKYFMHT